MCIWFLISGTSSIVICHWSYCHIFFLRPTSLDSRKHHIFFLNAKGQTVSHCNPAGVRWFFIQASIASWVGWGGRQIYMLCHLVSTWQCIAGRNVVLSRFNLIEKKHDQICGWNLKWTMLVWMAWWGHDNLESWWILYVFRFCCFLTEVSTIS